MSCRDRGLCPRRRCPLGSWVAVAVGSGGPRGTGPLALSWRFGRGHRSAGALTLGGESRDAEAAGVAFQASPEFLAGAEET